MRYSDIESFISGGLTALGYSPLPAFEPGPANNAQLQRISAQSIVFISFGSGAQLSTENLFDTPFITVRAIGNQNDFDGAEKLAWDIDTLLLKVDSNAIVGTAPVLYITRSGGAPQLLEKDTADRYAFTCTYITETETGL